VRTRAILACADWQPHIRQFDLDVVGGTQRLGAEPAAQDAGRSISMKTRLFTLALSAFALGLGITLTAHAQGTPPNWAQVNPDGFGDAGNGIYALAPFNGQL
jgi:hypothetical protein